MTTSPFTKTIEMQFERVGKRTKLAGFIGQITDEAGVVLHSQLYDDKQAAETDLDALVHDLLADYRGLVDTVPCRTCGGDGDCPDCGAPTAPTHNWPAIIRLYELHCQCGYYNACADVARRRAENGDDEAARWFERVSAGERLTWNTKADPPDGPPTILIEAPTEDCPDDARAEAERLAQHLATLTRIPTHVIAQDGRYFVQGETDVDVYGGRANIVATFQPEPPRAVTLTSILIDAAAQRNRLCANCEGAHWGWQCPFVLELLHSPPNFICTSCGDPLTQDGFLCAACREVGEDLPTPYDTADLAHLWATSRTLLAAKLARLTRRQLHAQAVAYAAWLDTQTHAGLSAASVLHIWETFILAGGDPAMRVAA